MTKSRKRSARRSARRSRGRSQRRSRSQRGGSYPTSAWGWQLNNLGDGWTQFMNSLSLQPGQNLGTQQSNAIVPQSNVNAQNQQPHLSPNLETQKGGRRRSRAARKSRASRKSRAARRTRSRKGGNLIGIVDQALLPLSLMAMQQKVGKRNRKGGNLGAILSQAALPASLIAMQQKIGKRSRKH